MGGAMLGFIIVLFLLACTAAFSAAAEGSPVPLFTDASLLLCCNVIVMGVAPVAVDKVYANCSDVFMASISPVSFLLLACYYDVGLRTLLQFMLARAGRVDELDRIWFLVSAGLVPLAHLCPLTGLLIEAPPLCLIYTALGLTIAGSVFGVLAEWRRFGTGVSHQIETVAMFSMPMLDSSTLGATFGNGLSLTPNLRHKGILKAC